MRVPVARARPAAGSITWENASMTVLIVTHYSPVTVTFAELTVKYRAAALQQAVYPGYSCNYYQGI